MDTATKNPDMHCFREDSSTEFCRDCGYTAQQHSGCDCEDEVQAALALADAAEKAP